MKSGDIVIIKKRAFPYQQIPSFCPYANEDFSGRIATVVWVNTATWVLIDLEQPIKGVIEGSGGVEVWEERWKFRRDDLEEIGLC